MRLMSYLVVAGITVQGLSGCSGTSAPIPQGANFSMSGPSFISKVGTPTTLFASIRRQDGSREFVYFMVIKPPDPSRGTAQASSGESNASGVNGVVKFKMTINGTDLVVDYKMTARPDSSTESESLVVNAQNQPLDKGRVFLVDLSANPISIVPHDVKLPAPTADATNPWIGEEQAQIVLKALEPDPDVAKFIKALR